MLQKKTLFAKRGRTMEIIPPMLNALKQHITRSALQVFKWKEFLIVDPSSTLPDPSEWDWQETSLEYSSVWTTLPAAAKGCRILFKCRCKKCCEGATNEIVMQIGVCLLPFFTP